MNPFIKRKTTKVEPVRQPMPHDIADGVLGITKLFTDMQELKNDVVTTVDNKINQVLVKVQELDDIMTPAIEELRKATDGIEQLKEDALDIIEDIKKGEKGEPGKDADEESMRSDLAKEVEQVEKRLKDCIPVIDEKKLIEKLLKQLPENKASLKIIQEQMAVEDPESIIDRIMALPEEKRAKLRVAGANIDGLAQTIRSMRTQLGNGYQHGGGDTVVAGTNITIDTNANGQKVINAENGGIVVGTVASAAQPTIDTDAVNAFTITAQAVAITSMSANLSGSPTNFKELSIRIKDDGTARAITWGASFEQYGDVRLPLTTVATKLHTMGFSYNTVTSKWGCILSVPNGIAPVPTGDVLIVGGGGGSNKGGGGGGEYRYLTATPLTAGTYTVTVGSGGAAALLSFNNGSNGNSSVFGSTTAVGGGGGGGGSNNGSSGASGGGGAYNGTGGSATAGFAGGSGVTNAAGGGGGSAAVGSAGVSNTGGDGGTGTNSSITGSSVGYAGGGGGGGSSAGGTATQGGGIGRDLTGNPGTANTGGGAGGGGENSSSGGSGVVIVTYLTADLGTCTGGTKTTNGLYTVHTFTSSGTFTSVEL